MNRFWKGVRISALTLLLAAGSATVATAQTGGSTGGGTGGGTTTSDTRSDQGFDLGWLGLIGLAGLIPLFLRRNGNTMTHTGGNHGQMNR